MKRENRRVGRRDHS